MSFIYQFNSFLNLGACKEYSIMARSKSPTAGTKQKDAITNNRTPAAPAGQAVAPTGLAEATRPETRKLGIVNARANVVPIKLEEEIRQRAYELYQERGYLSGHE